MNRPDINQPDDYRRCSPGAGEFRPAAPVIAASVCLLAFGAAAAAQVHDIHRAGEERAFVTVEANDAWEPDGFEPATILRAAPVDTGPAIDGRADDPAWSGAAELTVPLAFGGVREATLKAVYTDKEVFLLVSWPDPTRDDQYTPGSGTPDRAAMSKARRSRTRCSSV